MWMYHTAVANMRNIDVQKNYLTHIYVKMTGSVVNSPTTHRVLRARTESASTYMFKSTSR